MKMPIPILLLGLGLAGCVNTSDDLNFERMNETELAAYNQSRNLSQMIVCTDDQGSFSRVRRRRCMTVEQAYGSAQQATQLGVLDTIPGYSGSE